MENIVVSKEQNGQTKKIENAATAGYIAELLTTNPASQAAFAIATNEKIVKAMSMGTGVYVASGLNSDKEPVIVKMDKANVNKYADAVKACHAAVSSALTLKKVTGELGKRGRTAIELDFGEF